MRPSAMRTKQLEGILAEETRELELGGRSPADLPERFERLRGYGLLPGGRAKNSRELSLEEIVAGMLGLAAAKPGFAGLAAKLLNDLRPVGGAVAGFNRCPTFGKAVEAILQHTATLQTLVEVRVSESEIYANSHCRASITYMAAGTILTAHYVGPSAVSLLQPGAEKDFDARALISSVITEMVLFPDFFRSIASGIQDSNADFSQDSAPEDETEEQYRERRAAKLGLTRGSRFLNVAVDTQVTWPGAETVVRFRGHRLVLLPKTRDNTTSVHIDLHGERLSDEQARTLVNEFLSVLTWCDDQFAVLQDGWSGTPVPVAVPRRDLAFATAHQWVFDRQIPAATEARKALAIYREGRNAEQNYLVGYAVLCYYKIVEVKHRSTGDAKRWFRDNFELLRQEGRLADRIARFDAIRGEKPAHEYLWQACRSAVAHANKPFLGDPDDSHELRRLHVAASILRELARRFIRNELGVSDCVYDGS